MAQPWTGTSSGLQWQYLSSLWYNHRQGLVVTYSDNTSPHYGNTVSWTVLSYKQWQFVTCQLRNFSEYEKIAKSTPVNILKANITKGIIEEGNSRETNIVKTVYEHKSRFFLWIKQSNICLSNDTKCATACQKQAGAYFSMWKSAIGHIDYSAKEHMRQCQRT